MSGVFIADVMLEFVIVSRTSSPFSEHSQDKRALDFYFYYTYILFISAVDNFEPQFHVS